MFSILDEHNDSFYSHELDKATMPTASFFGGEQYYDTHQQPQGYESRNDGMFYGTSERSSLVLRPNASKAEEPSNDRSRKMTNTELEKECAKLEKNCIHWEKRKDYYKTAYYNLKTRYHELATNYSDQKRSYETSFSSLETKHNNLATKYNSLQTKYDTQKQSIDSLRQEMKNIQEEVSDVLVETWSSKTDDQLAKDIDRLRKSIESWSRGLEVGTIRELQDKDSQVAANLKRKMCEIMPALTGEEPAGEELLERLAAAGVRKMILTAVLSHELSFRIIGNPFFFLQRKVGVDDQDHLTDETCISPRTIDAMTKFIDQEHHIHIWRSAVLRGMGLEHEVTWRDACLQRMEAFAEHPVNELIQARNASSESQLEDIFVRAGKISYELWTRRSKIEIWGMSRMRSSSWGADICELDENQLATLSVLSDSESGDALAVVHPLIWAFGTEEAKNYDQSTESRVLSKAEVWA